MLGRTLSGPLITVKPDTWSRPARLPLRKRGFLSTELAAQFWILPQNSPVAVKAFNSKTELKVLVPEILGVVEGWKGYLNIKAGYVRAAKAMYAFYNECLRLGTKFILGSNGHAIELIFEKNRPVDAPGRGRFLRVRVATGNIYNAYTTILCLGAYTTSILTVSSQQLKAKSWSVGHVQLSRAEAESLAGIPVVNCRNIGFLFEPDPDARKLKIVANGAGYVNYVKVPDGDEKASVPVGFDDDIPMEDELRIRRLLLELFPQLAQRPIVDKFVCWCTDTADSNYVIDYIPGYDGQTDGVANGRFSDNGIWG